MFFNTCSSCNSLRPALSYAYVCVSPRFQVLDEDSNVAVVGVSPCTGLPTLRDALELPKEDETKNSTLDVESIAAGGNHVCLVIANRTVS